eukprot:CAMPEP_0172177658 /NCGR_PEP_ID=MMETSP1050-20130122/15573_1 /TAXON_ID=233186 /ORGANISM="Cryptomonas curvata, Strain CCAP979/52" /LENGTH=241 /DNA_ID=CAMNT_0012850231 /DNA_START=296 /DNA_END=1018 /DNA_ORIENTATION=+
MVTDLFTAKFKCSSKEALGQPLTHLISDRCKNLDLEMVLKTVVSGQRVSGLFGNSGSGTSSDNFCPLSEEITFTPVVETPNGRVRHIIVRFSEPAVLPGFCTKPCTNVRQPNPSPSSPISTDLNQSPFPRAPYNSFRSSSPASSHPPPTPRGHPAPAQAIILRPRSSHRAPASRAAEVAVTPELLGALRSLPLPQAAAAAGISATAFKKACRRLGLHRWGYTRGPAKRAPWERSAAAARSA